MALLAHPPSDIAAVEIWACLGLLHHGAEERWLDSTRRRVLLGLLDGGLDRVTEAALFALVVSAWIDPTARADVASIVTGRLTELAPRVGARSVAELALATPDLDLDTRKLATAIVMVPVIPRPRGRSRLLLRWRRG
jgi:hypothetical protein